MYCQNCGKEIREGSKFCDGCGTALGDNQVAEDSQVNQQPVQKVVPKKSNKGCGCLIAIGFFCLLMLAVSMSFSNSNKNNNGETPQTQENQTQASTGETTKNIAMGQAGAISEGLYLKVNSVVESDSISAMDGYMSYKPESGKFAIVNVTVLNQSKESQNLLLNYFDLIGPDEAEYTSTIVAMADDKFLSVDTINPNLQITGNLVFEIPKELSAQDCVLQYRDMTFFNDISYFNLK